jgi:hypothetical protein
MSADDVSHHVTRLLDYSFGRQAATTSPSAPPYGGAFSQGTLSPAESKGVVIVGSVGSTVSSGMSPGFVSATNRSGIRDSPRETIRSVCMFLSSQEYMNSACLGCVGVKGEKFCTKRKNGSGELDTCGVISHA